MTYTGEVTPGGPPARRELSGLTVTKVSVGMLDNNAYLLRCNATGEQLLIDAADEPTRLLALLGDDGLATVVTTHRHPDHWQGLSQVLVATGARSVAHAADAEEIPVVQDTVDEGDAVRVGDCELRVVHLVGHTPGSIALVYTDPDDGVHIFTGDSLFPGGVGNTRGDADNFRSLIDDVEHKIFDVYGDDTWIYPGHGKDTTLGAERPAIPQWRARGW